MGFLPSVPFLFPPDDDSLRKAALSINYEGPGEHCKDPQRVLGRAPADITFWVGASDPILSQLRGSEDPQPQKFFGHYICNFTCVLVHF